MSTKAETRKWRQRFPYSPEQKKRLSEKIVAHLLASPLVTGAAQIGLFIALPWEPDISSLLSTGRAVVPKVDAATLTLNFHKVKNTGELVPGYAKIWEPAQGLPPADPWQTTDVLLIPGSGFDRHGARVGSGKGFYDRFLPQFPGIRLAVAFEVQISQSPLDQEPFDARMSHLCTETGIRKVMP